ncbi:MAG: NADPH:quinone oxidoreductase family protein [Pigmentiphaga sp.]|uniref:NADPH:quinone oxidoreductase family protein n=1 Tax=Pigmentiphaga sp. TaxID=1977564 RepID=UPI0029B35210|nr:NADPH:quinone oxidoreductase family protein [Pigmentiphaga sp.]MDX3908043.1 NADPH:quinone oxidoreductase family protein [Pigmentiphaga sp.]
MRAALIHEFGPVESLRVADTADPVAGPGQVVVDVRATAINFVDTLVITGKYQFLPDRPFAPGKLPTGIVSAVGPGVETLRAGDRVLTLAEHGGYAEKVAVAAKDCFALPDSLSFPDAAAMSLAFDTAWFALCERARAKPGETVLVLGATGSVGLASIQLAKAYGLRVLAGVSSAAKAGQVLAAGADGIVDLSRPQLIDSLREQVREQTAGAGADIVIDPLGGDIFDAAIRAVAWRGRLVVVGFAAGRIPTLKVNYVMLKNMEVSGLQVSDYRKRTPDEMAHCIHEIFRLYAEGKLNPGKVTTYPLERVAEALAHLQNRSAPGRLVLTMEAGS